MVKKIKGVSYIGQRMIKNVEGYSRVIIIIDCEG
jgi:hypothetical protein